MDIPLDRLVVELRSENIATRAVAAQSLCHEGEGARLAAEALVLAAGDGAEDVREWAVSALEDLGAPAAADVAKLAALLTNEKADVRYWAATLLGRLESEAADATPQLVQALSADTALAVRERAALALGQIGAAAKLAVEPLKAAAAGAEPRLARLAATALTQIEGAGK